MKSDNLKTAAGVLVIAIVVIATFLYGNAQRQNQLRQAQDASPSKTPAVSATPSQDSAGVVATGGNVHNTAPVATPAASSLQGNGLPAASPAPVVTPSGTITAIANAAATPVPATTTIPDTGSTALPLVGILAILAALLYLRQSRSRLLAAARAER